MKNESTDLPQNPPFCKADVSSSGLSKVKKGTGWYMLTTTILAGGVMFCTAQMFGTDGAIITGILLLIAMLASVRYNI